MRRGTAWIVGVGLVAMSPTNADAPKGVTGRVAVYSRSVTAVITARGGKAPAAPPSAADLEVLEDGVPATVTGVDALVPPAPPPASAATDAPTAEVEARPLPQVLWFDLRLLRARSVKEAVAGFRKSAPRLLARGPVQIVVADPEPTVTLPPTDEARALDAALVRIGSTLVGRDRLTAHRRDYLDAAAARPGIIPLQPSERPAPTEDGNAQGSTSDSLVKSFAEEEVQLLKHQLERLRSFAEGTLGPPPRVLYLTSDGFDLDPISFYSNRPPATTLQIGPRVQALVKETTETLARTGWIVVPVAPGASVGAPMSGRAAESSGAASLSDASPGAFLVSHPVESLRTIAEETGGEVLVDPDEVGGPLASLARTYLVSYSIGHAPDGKAHRLEVRSRRPDLVVRSASSVASGTPEGGATRRGVDLLAGGAAGDLPVAVACAAPEPAEAGRVRSELTVKVTLASVKNVLARLGSGSLRFSLVVEVPGHEPVAHHETVALPGTLPDVFSLKLPLGRAKEATRVAVVVEELTTGVWGAGQARLAAAP